MGSLSRVESRQEQLPIASAPWSSRRQRSPNSTTTRGTCRAAHWRDPLLHRRRKDRRQVEYSLYAFNPGILLGGLANQNQLEKSVTYAWSDSKPVQAVSPATGSTSRVKRERCSGEHAGRQRPTMDPRSEAADVEQATAFLERQLYRGCRRAHWLRLLHGEDQVATVSVVPSAKRLHRAVNGRRSRRRQPGRDRRRSDSQLPRHPQQPARELPDAAAWSRALPDNGTYKTSGDDAHPSATSWSVSAGPATPGRHDYPAAFPNTANGPFDEDRRVYSFKANGTYTLPYDIQLSGVYQFKAGENYARTLAISAPASCACARSRKRWPSRHTTSMRRITCRCSTSASRSRSDCSIRSRRASSSISTTSAMGTQRKRLASPLDRRSNDPPRSSPPAR